MPLHLLYVPLHCAYIYQLSSHIMSTNELLVKVKTICVLVYSRKCAPFEQHVSKSFLLMGIPQRAQLGVQMTSKRAGSNPGHGSRREKPSFTRVKGLSLPSPRALRNKAPPDPARKMYSVKPNQKRYRIRSQILVLALDKAGWKKADFLCSDSLGIVLCNLSITRGNNEDCIADTKRVLMPSLLPSCLERLPLYPFFVCFFLYRIGLLVLSSFCLLSRGPFSLDTPPNNSNGNFC